MLVCYLNSLLLYVFISHTTYKKASNYCEMFRQALFFCNFVKKGLFTLIVEQFL